MTGLMVAAVLTMLSGACLLGALGIRSLKNQLAAARDFHSVLNDSREAWRDLYHDTLHKLEETNIALAVLRAKRPIRDEHGRFKSKNNV